MIHPTAIIHPDAQVPKTTKVGPYAVIDAQVSLGEHCIVGPHVYLTGILKAGSHNQFHAGAVIGDAPQDLKYAGEPTSTLIGDHNVFREHVTVHRSTKLDAETVIGTHNLLMAHSHVGHNSHLGDHIIMANGALLGGHAVVGDRAFISGNCLVHQFVRVGTLALMQGGSAASKDVPPYTVVRGYSGVCGLNIIGLRRAGLNPQERIELKQLYRVLFRSGHTLRAAIALGREKFTGAAAQILLDFAAATTRRGLCSDTSVTAEDAET